MTDDRRTSEAEPQYAGLRMTAREYVSLEDDRCKYELIDGVVMMSPSPTFGHQAIAMEIARQITSFLHEHQIGQLVHETDVVLDDIRVYRPDLVFLTADRVPKRDERITTVPNLIIEILSPATRALDLSTKRDDYEQFGVSEYWMVDPGACTITFLRLSTPSAARGKVAESSVRAKRGKPGKLRYRRISPKGSRFASSAVPGFVLDIASVKKVMRR